MIVIGRSIVHPYITNEYEPFAAEKQQILSIMAGNQEVYSFRTADELSFDLNLRVNIIISALELFKVDFSFVHFSNPFATPVLEKNVSWRIRASSKHTTFYCHTGYFQNGKLYGTECATAMIIIFIKLYYHCMRKKLSIVYLQTFYFIHGTTTKI